VLAIRPTAQGLSVAALLKALNNPSASTISGTIASFKGEFTTIAMNNPTATATGTGAITVRDGLIRGMNLPNQLLSKIEGLPFITGDLRKRVPPEFDSIISKPDTVVKELRSTFTVEGGTILLRDLFLESDIFSLKSSGRYSFSGQVNLDAQLLFRPEFSKALVGKVKELAVLVDSEGRLVLPLSLSGTFPAVIVVPDLKNLAKSVSVDTLRQGLDQALKDPKQLKKNLGKILGF
jgi:hypothetical protein